MTEPNNGGKGGDPYDALTAPSTPDTGGVEGPYRVEYDGLDGYDVIGPSGEAFTCCSNHSAAKSWVRGLNMAYAAGHKTGASGSDGLRAAAERVVFASKNRAHDPIALHRLIQEDLAAAISDGGMGDE